MNKKGITLLEVMVSFGILAVIMSAITYVFVQGSSQVKQADTLKRLEMNMRRSVEGENLAGIKVESADSILSFRIGTYNYTISGEMKTYSDAEGRINYGYFTAEDPS